MALLTRVDPVNIKSIVTNRHRKFFRIATKKLNRTDIFQVSAVIVKGSKVISTGVSQYKTHPTQSNLNFRCNHDSVFHNLHAEIDALNHCQYKDISLNNAEIFVYRQDSGKNPANSKPCEVCQRALAEKGIKHVYYVQDGLFNYMKL